jgi:F-type H+-transporting ATPase subunit gamma
MVQLVQLRNRIKAIETIKKITHAMRLISMSTHSRLKHKEEPLRLYHAAINDLFNRIQQSVPEWTHPIMHPNQETQHTQLIILIGSSRGLCGGFDTALFNYYQSYIAQHPRSKYAVIAVGKRAVGYCNDRGIGPIIKSFEELSATTILSIAHAITHTIMHVQEPYGSVVAFSNHFKSFFNQKPHASPIIPFSTHSHANINSNPAVQDYAWEQNAHEILDTLAHQCVNATIQHLLFQSLLAELAARFLSMDASTRNAQTLLENTKLDYNKLRQAKITKELAELSGSF